MLFEILFDQCVLLSIYFFVRIYLSLILIQNALENHLTHSRETLVFVVLANCEVNVVSLDEFLEHSHQNFEKSKHFFILVSLSKGFAL